mgnify:CR=1 FL=1
MPSWIQKDAPATTAPLQHEAIHGESNRVRPSGDVITATKVPSRRLPEHVIAVTRPRCGNFPNTLPLPQGPRHWVLSGHVIAVARAASCMTCPQMRKNGRNLRL